MSWIMDHMYTYPDKYIELPLRTTYILNSNPKLKPADFKSLMMEHIASLPSQPRSLPHSFLSNFIKKCFTKDLESADLDQALTALDYLKNLEDRRKRELAKVMREIVGSRDVRILELIARMQKVDTLYSRVLVGIRQWTMIHEFENGSFNRSNCIAMLNTLYPVDEPDVNSTLTADVLAANRQHLWKCLVHFANSGPTILNSLKSARGGYPALCDKIHAYLRLALDMINQCEEIYRQYKSSTTIISRTSSFSSQTDNDVISVSEKGSTLEKIVWQLGNLKNFRSHRKLRQSNNNAEFTVSAIHQDSDIIFYD
ncbi:hypothetical protein EV426DRAFT_574058 [Tirmania nivea]|nr:hypothetical protein EV426DRAFT_574058 [Tirmania nivea]